MLLGITKQVKQWCRSWWLLILWGPLILIAIRSTKLFQIGLIALMQDSLLPVYFCVVAAIMGIMAAHQVTEFEMSLRPHYALWVQRELSLLTFLLPTFLIPLAMMGSSFLLVELPVSLFTNVLVYWLVNWLIQALFFSSVGLLLGGLISNRSPYLIALVLVLLMSPIAQRTNGMVSTTQQLQNLLNLMLDDPTRYRFYSQGYWLDTQFWMNLVCYVGLSLCLLFLLACQIVCRGI